MKQYKILVNACAEPFWGCWSSYLLIFRDSWSWKPSIYIHVDLHTHTGFAVDAVAGSEPEGLHCSAQPPCCWVECRFHRLALIFWGSGKTWLLQGLAQLDALRVSEISGKHFNQNMVRHRVGSNHWVLDSRLPMREPKDNVCLTELSNWNYNSKDPPRTPSWCQRSSASLQRKCNLWYQMCFWQLTHINYSHLFKTCADTATGRPLRYIRPITTNCNLLSLQAVK